MTRALVLGGGGPVGVAWEIGVLAGLADAGFDVSQAERIVGTSAGAIVGAQIASGRRAQDLYAEHRDLDYRGRVEADVRRLPTPDLGPLMAFFMRRPFDTLPSASLLVEIGTYALASNTIGEDDFVEGVGRLILTGRSWPVGFACTAIDAETGDLCLWDAASGVDLARAVASSCAVPGQYPPVTIAGRRTIDGGVRSAINVDTVAGADVILVLAMAVRPVDVFMVASARRELSELTEPGMRTGLIVPDEACLDAFGGDLMDWSRHEAVAAAGRAQGRREAGLLPFWSAPD